MIGGEGENPPVDASGRLPNGLTFASAAEFKRLLADEDDHLAEAFLEHLATYALRRVLTIDDKAQLKEIAQSENSGGFRMKRLIRSFVLSDLFKQR